jgi:hypothetical protein
MGRRALSWFLKSLGRHLRLKPVKWQVFYIHYFVLYIEVFQGGHIIAAHYQTLSGIRRLHHIPGSVPSMAGINFHPALEQSN